VAVPTDHQAQVDELLADYRRSREQLASVQRSLVSIRESASSDDGSVTATVGPQGVLAELAIAEGAYRRHRPSELAKLIVQATKDAAGKAAARAQEALVPVLPPDADPEALLAGRADLRQDEIAPEPPGADEVAPAAQRGKHADHDESFEHRSWLDGRTA
jgi:DNA-binding protein YbaB